MAPYNFALSGRIALLIPETDPKLMAAEAMVTLRADRLLNYNFRELDRRQFRARLRSGTAPQAAEECVPSSFSQRRRDGVT